MSDSTIVIGLSGAEIVAITSAEDKPHAESIALEMVGTTQFSPTRAQHVPVTEVLCGEVIGKSFTETTFKWRP